MSEVIIQAKSFSYNEQIMNSQKIKLELLGMLSKLRQETEKRMWTKLIMVYSVLMPLIITF